MRGLIIAPFVVVKEFYFPLVMIAKCLKKMNHHITMVHCKHAMKKNCTAILAKGVSLIDQNNNSLEAKQICDLCFKNSTLASKIYAWETEWLDESPTRQAKKRNPELWKMAGYELVLSQKIELNKLDLKLKQTWETRYHILCNLQKQVQAIVSKKQFDYAICYNSLYGINQLFHQECKKRRIPFLSVHSSLHMGKEDEYILYHENVFNHLKEIKTNFKIKKIDINNEDRQNILSHVESLKQGKKLWAYSMPPSLKSKNLFHAAKTKKILVILSSPDELNGLKLSGLLPGKVDHVFKDQIAWLKWIFHLARKYPELKFYIRVHPRILPNKRDPVVSPFFEKPKKLKNKTNLKNVIFSLQPGLDSLWDHLSDTSLVLNAWSSASEIFQFHKVQVLTFFPQFSNSGKLLDFTASNRKSYELKIISLLGRPQTKNQTRRIWWWLKNLISHNTFVLPEQKSWIQRVIRIFCTKRFWANYHLSFVQLSSPIFNQKSFPDILKKYVPLI